MEFPEPRYVRTSDGTYIAYLVLGDGPVDIAWQFDWVGNLDCIRDSPFDAAWFEGLASVGRVILHDRRATGLSSRSAEPPNLETRAEDLRAVLDHVGSRSTVVGAFFEGLAPGVLLAATDPGRVRGLVWWNPTPRTTWAPDYPWGETPAQIEDEIRGLERWGTLEFGQAWADECEVDGARPTDAEVRAFAKSSRNTCTPDVALAFARQWWDTDVRAVLPAVRVPTLMLVESPGPKHLAKAEHAASLMPAAEIVEFPSTAWPTAVTMQDYIRPPLEALRRFAGLPAARSGLDSVLATVLFTDIVGSTERQAAVGDLVWKNLVERHHAMVREHLLRWRGVEHDTAGDGFYATFDGPARAIRCALEITENVRALGFEVRAGIHIGDCELIDGKVGGIAVAIGARISARAEPSQVLVSQTVKDLVAGSGMIFRDAGEHELKGVPDPWHLYSVLC